MAIQRSLPFEEGKEAEAITFMSGFRGAWFRCKIKTISLRKRQIWYAMDYYDYPDDKIQWTKLYQIPPESSSRRKGVRKQLMLRPEFPRIYHENEKPDVHTISEVMVVVDGSWRVGDLVDWWKDGGFWSGTITEIESDDMVKIKLIDPPHGEGSTYSANYKDLRPSLDWSPEHGWKVSTPQEIQNDHSCPRLIQPGKQDVDDNLNMKLAPRSTLEFNGSMSSHISTSALPHPKGSENPKDCPDTSKKEIPQTRGTSMDSSIKPGGSENVSGTNVRDFPAEVLEVVPAGERCQVNGSSKKARTSGTTSVNLTTCSSIESTIMDLEELVNRVKWLRRILNFGTSSHSPGTTWNFLEHTAVPTAK